MTALMIVLLTTVLIIVIFVVIYVIAFLWIRRLRKEAAQALRDEVGEEVYHVADCNFFGILSSGYKQLRGNGLLALTDEGLHFRMLLPRRSRFIPLAAIRDLSHPRWFLGKTKAKELLRVDFINRDGNEDACAWLVRFPRWWGEAITALREGNPHRDHKGSICSRQPTTYPNYLPPTPKR
jgi:hypothetical protein